MGELSSYPVVFFHLLHCSSFRGLSSKKKKKATVHISTYSVGNPDACEVNVSVAGMGFRVKWDPALTKNHREAEIKWAVLRQHVSCLITSDNRVLKAFGFHSKCRSSKVNVTWVFCFVNFGVSCFPVSQDVLPCGTGRGRQRLLVHVQMVTFTGASSPCSGWGRWFPCSPTAVAENQKAFRMGSRGANIY